MGSPVTITPDPVGNAPVTIMPDAPQEQPGFLDKNIPLDSYGDATLSGLQSVGRGFRSVGKGAWDMIQPPHNAAEWASELVAPGVGPAMVRGNKSIIDSGRQAVQVPSAIHDINQAPDPVGLYGKAAQDTAGEGAAQALTALATEGASRAIPKIGEIELSPRARAVGKVVGQEAITKIPVIGRVVRRPSFGDYIDAFKTPAEDTAGIFRDATEHNAPFAGEEQPSTMQDWWKSRGGVLTSERPNGPIMAPRPSPSVPGPAQIISLPSEAGPAVEAPSVNTSPKNVGNLLNEGLGGRPLIPNVPLRDQGVALPLSPSTEIPAGFTPVESSAVRGFKYNPGSSEMEVISKDGSHHIYGDVSPEQAQTFQQNPSTGRAWQELRNSPSAKVAKVVNGQRVAVQPPIDLRSASPQGSSLDLTMQQALKSDPFSKESVAAENQWYQQAKQELGEGANISKIASRAQELKMQARKPPVSASPDDDLTGILTESLKQIRNRPR